MQLIELLDQFLRPCPRKKANGSNGLPPGPPPVDMPIMTTSTISTVCLAGGPSTHPTSPLVLMPIADLPFSSGNSARTWSPAKLQATLSNSSKFLIRALFGEVADLAVQPGSKHKQLHDFGACYPDDIHLHIAGDVALELAWVLFGQQSQEFIQCGERRFRGSWCRRIGCAHLKDPYCSGSQCSFCCVDTIQRSFYLRNFVLISALPSLPDSYREDSIAQR